MKRVVITDQAFGNTRIEEALIRKAGADLRSLQLSDEHETAEAVRGANAVLNNLAPMTGNVMAGLAPGAVVVRYGVGIDNVDIRSAKCLGVRVCNVPDYGVDDVADHAVAMAVYLARKVHKFDAAIRHGEWEITKIISALRSLPMLIVGLVGFGRIAQAVAKRMAAFGCTVIAYDPFISPDTARDAGVTLCSLDDTLARANILSLHVPLTKETHHMINGQSLGKLPPDAVVINTSRGGLIDEDALAAALINGHISAAGLDVFEAEPLPETSPLRSAPNSVLSPHAAFYSDASVRRLQTLAAEEVVRALNGEPLRCEVV
ncbi:MAG: C-terminal binding protein [Rhodobacteraceae bacterium]|nr:C-terminal binding protein [Paracoccaceae bacterium]